MSKQTLNLGTAPAGADGDTVRAAFVKVEANTAELYAWLGASGSPAALPANFPVTRAFSRSTVLGAVAQASGVPTGALIEMGSNANGRYSKFAGGLMICETAAVTVAVGAGGVTGGNITLPAAFADANYTVGISGAPSATNDHYGFISLTQVNTTVVNWIFRNGSTAQNMVGVRILAVGRWY